MLSKATIKYIHSLEQKKYRRLEGAFVVEGHKSVGDMLRAGWQPRMLLATEEWTKPAGCQAEIMEVTDEELQRASLLQHPSQVLAVFPIPKTSPLPSSRPSSVRESAIPSQTPPLLSSRPSSVRESAISSQTPPPSSLLLCLDGVQDPGNMGTIIRSADWFGITDIVCSPDTADVYNPKVVQATMGSIARVGIHYTNLPEFLQSLPKDTPIYGTLLDGEDIYTQNLTPGGVIVMGNEGNGISQEVRTLLTHRLLIPSFAAAKAESAATGSPESLNVSVATAIILSEFRSRVKKT